MQIADFQAQMASLYIERDRTRGVDATFRWLTEEVGEVARALRKGDRANLEQELGDAFAWLASLANLTDVDLAAAAARYSDGCPRCGRRPCECPL